MKGKLMLRQTTILGLERLCFDCEEWWPQDEEFWYFDKDGKVQGRCRACWVDFNKSRRKKDQQNTWKKASRARLAS